jgi:hypothetical protein
MIKKIPGFLFYKNISSGSLAIAAVTLYIIVVASIPCLWAWNIYNLIQCDFEPSYKAEVVYGIGTFTPIFLITGFIDVGK